MLLKYTGNDGSYSFSKLNVYGVRVHGNISCLHRWNLGDQTAYERLKVFKKYHFQKCRSRSRILFKHKQEAHIVQSNSKYTFYIRRYRPRHDRLNSHCQTNVAKRRVAKMHKTTQRTISQQRPLRISATEMQFTH